MGGFFLFLHFWKEFSGISLFFTEKGFQNASANENDTFNSQSERPFEKLRKPYLRLFCRSWLLIWRSWMNSVCFDFNSSSSIEFLLLSKFSIAIFSFFNCKGFFNDSKRSQPIKLRLKNCQPSQSALKASIKKPSWSSWVCVSRYFVQPADLGYCVGKLPFCIISVWVDFCEIFSFGSNSTQNLRSCGYAISL